MQPDERTKQSAAGTNRRPQHDLLTAIRGADGATKRTVRRGQFVSELSRAPTGICLIESGTVMRAMNDGDKRLIVGFAGQGDILYASRLLAHAPGDPAAFLNRSTWAMTEVRITDVPWDVARRIPGLVSMAGEQSERECLALEQRLFVAHYASVSARIGTVLLGLKQRFGVPRQGGGSLISVPITHEQLAAAIGSTRETVTLALGELENRKGAKGKKRLITFDRRYIVVVDEDGLRALAAR